MPSYCRSKKQIKEMISHFIRKSFWWDFAPEPYQISLLFKSNTDKMYKKIISLISILIQGSPIALF